jgi:hypothetical protein
MQVRLLINTHFTYFFKCFHESNIHHVLSIHIRQMCERKD